MKNKNYFKVGVAVLLSGVLLFAIALTGNAAGNGYEQLKVLLREEPAQLNNVTVHMDMNISDNGTSVLQAVGNIKTDEISKNMSGLFNVTGKIDPKSFEVYKNGDIALFHLTGSENWYQTTSTDNYPADRDMTYGRYDSQDTKGNQQLRESIMDLLMGDLKDQVVLDEVNGLRTFSLTMDKGNMPVLIQTVFSAENLNKEEPMPTAFDMAKLPAELQGLVNDMMETRNLIDLSSNRTLEKIKVSVTVDQKNQPQGIELSTVFSGIAKDGTAHTYDINCKITLSDVNTTVPDKANVGPSSITTIDATQFESAGINHRMN